MPEKLRIEKIKGICEFIKKKSDEDIKKIIQEKFNDQKATMLVQHDEKIFWGVLVNNQPIFSCEDHQSYFAQTAFCQEIRIFNTDAELLLQRKKANEFSGRYRKDGVGSEDSEYIATKQILWGTHSKEYGAKGSSEWLEISEPLRGLRMVLPLAKCNLNDDKRRAWIKLHNYIEYNETGQGSIVDCRLVELSAEGVK